jgi:Flp pilus assembly pilin Flp
VIDRLLSPKLLLLGAAAVASLGLGETVSVGSIFVAATVVVLGGLLTLRNNLKTFWKNLAEERGEQVKVLEQEVRDQAATILDNQRVAAEEMIRQNEEQRELRHTLKGQVAELAHKLQLEEAKHDLSSVTTRLETLEAFIHARTPIVDSLAETSKLTHDRIEANNVLLTEIAATLVNGKEGNHE